MILLAVSFIHPDRVPKIRLPIINTGDSISDHFHIFHYHERTNVVNFYHFSYLAWRIVNGTTREIEFNQFNQK